MTLRLALAIAAHTAVLLPTQLTIGLLLIAGGLAGAALYHHEMRR